MMSDVIDSVVGLSQTAEPSQDNTAEQQLSASIVTLWASQQQHQTVAKKTKAELRTIRQELAEKLYHLKQLLARPGRGGQWTAFLEANAIPRSTADRLVLCHATQVCPDAQNDGVGNELDQEMIERYADVMWGKVSKRLTTHDAVYTFVLGLVRNAGMRTEWQQTGTLLLHPCLNASEAAEPTVLSPEELAGATYF